jgi:unsaturated rhamnogalacturonyl hydrolase
MSVPEGRAAAGLDRSQARLARPPEPPADPADLTPPVLAETGRRIARRAEDMGLTQWFWGEGVVLLGMLRLADALGDPVPPFVTGFVDRHVDGPGLELGHVNNLAPGAACVRLLAETGDERYARACAHLLEWLGAHATRAPNGAIEHWPGGVWADTVFMAGVFLLHHGRHAGRPDLIAEAGRQLLAHAEVLRDPGTGLYAHGSHRGETIWCFWGRANAWIALAGVEFLETAAAVPGDTEIADLATAVRPFLQRQLLALADLQPGHGVWDVLVDGQEENRGILETSAAAGIAAAMFRAAHLGLSPERLRASAWRALAGIHAYVADDGTLTRTSAGTVLQLVPFGYSVIRDDLIQPWGQGLALHAYAAALHDRRNHTND